MIVSKGVMTKQYRLSGVKFSAYMTSNNYEVQCGCGAVMTVFFWGGGLSFDWNGHFASISWASIS